MTPSGVYKTKNVRRRPELKRKDFEFLTTFVEGYAVDTEPSSGRDGSRCTSRRHDRPNTSARTSPSGRGGGSARGQSSNQVVHG